MPHSIFSEPTVPEESVIPNALLYGFNDTIAEGDGNDSEKGPLDVKGSSENMKETSHIRLEELFGSDEEDDEIPSQRTPRTEHFCNIKGDSFATLPVHFAPSGKYSDPEIMLAFYQRLFPFRYLFQWLNHAVKPSTDFTNREFAFTLPNSAYLRYQSFSSADILRKDVLRLNPSRFEIGPVYTANPRDRKSLRGTTAFKPIAKELVFDIDLTDYDQIRTCCDQAKICQKCWSFATMAIKVIDTALREDFGFEHILWVYSGRRGAHAWISDKQAREMDDGKRKAIAGYLEVIKGGSSSGKKVNVKRPLHPHLSRSLTILKDHFQSDILEDQDPWASPEKTEDLLQLLPDKSLNDALRKKWDSAPGRTSTSKWTDIDILAKAGVSPSLDGKALLEAKKDVILEYTYPRLDVEVSKKLVHLLKSPFVVHPGTGRVCVPIDINMLDNFDPLAVPTVIELLGEIDEWDSAHTKDKDNDTEHRNIQDYEKTSLKPYLEYFKAHIAAILKSEQGQKRERADGDAMDF